MLKRTSQCWFYRWRNKHDVTKWEPKHGNHTKEVLRFLLHGKGWSTFQQKCKNEQRHDKTNKVAVRPAKTQISLGIRPVWSVFAVRMEKPLVLSCPLSASEDSDQTGRMPRLIWVFAGCTLILLVLSCRDSDTEILLPSLILDCLQTDFNDFLGFIGNWDQHVTCVWFHHAFHHFDSASQADRYGCTSGPTDARAVRYGFGNTGYNRPLTKQLKCVENLRKMMKHKKKSSFIS